MKWHVTSFIGRSEAIGGVQYISDAFLIQDKRFTDVLAKN